MDRSSRSRMGSWSCRKLRSRERKYACWVSPARRQLSSAAECAAHCAARMFSCFLLSRRRLSQAGILL